MNRRNSIRLFLMLLIGSAVMLSAKGKGDYAATAAREKADYLFLEAQRYKALEKYDAYYDLIEASYNLNPQDQYVAKEYGYRQVLTAGDDSLQLADGMEKIGRYLESNPSDMNTANFYATILARMNRGDEASEVWRKLYEASDDKTVVGPVYANLLSLDTSQDSVRKAVRIIEEIENEEGGTNTNTTLRKMQYYLQIGDTAAVINEGKALMAAAPTSIENTVLMGNVYLQLNRRDSALQMFNKAVEMDPTSGLAYYSRANYYSATGDSVAYDREVFQALKLPDLDYEPKLGLLHDYVSNLYQDTLQWAKIDDSFQAMIDQYPHEPMVRLLYTDFLAITQDYPRAAEQLSYAMDLEPDDQQRWEMLAQLYYTTENYDKVMEAVNSGLRFFPDDTKLYTIAAVTLMQQDRYNQAIDFVNRAIDKADKDDPTQLAELIGTKGDIYYKAGQSDSAYVCYNMALKYDPGNSMLMNNAAYYLACENRDLDRALELIEKAVAADPESANSLDTYAWVLFKRKEYAKAREQIDAVMELIGNDITEEVYSHAGDIYFMTGDPDEALDFWKKALELKPGDELLQKKIKHKTFFFE